MPSPQSDRPNLDSHDFATVRQLYSEAQQWSRHYEMLVVNVNVLLISASLIFVGLAFGDNMTTSYSLSILVVPLLMAPVGFVLTQTLFNLYAVCVRRLIRLENLMNCYDFDRFDAIDGAGPLLEISMMKLPVRRPTSVRFFLGLQFLFAGVFTVLIVIRAVI